MLTLLPNVTQNPAAHESKADVIYCCLAASQGENQFRNTTCQRGFSGLSEAGSERFSIGAQPRRNEDGKGACRIVELRFFGGLSLEETAEALKISA